MENIIIRNAKPSDIKDIIDIERDSFSIGIIESEEVFLDRILTFSDGFLVSEDIELKKCIGYISSEIWNYNDQINSDSFTLGHSIKTVHNENGEEIYIASTGVLNQYHGKSLGNILFTELLFRVTRDYKNIKSAILIVSSMWHHAQKIYIKNGFEKRFVFKDFFQPGGKDSNDGIVMRKGLR